MILREDYSWVFQLIVVVLFVVVGLVIKALKKLFGNEEQQGRQQRPGGAAQGAQGAQGGKSAEEALEDFFQQAKRKRTGPQAQQGQQGQQGQQAPQAAKKPAGGESPKTLDDFFQRMGGGSSKQVAPPPASPVVPVATAVPVAKPVRARSQQTKKRKVVRRAVAAPAASSAYGADAVARAKATISQAHKSRRRELTFVEQTEADLRGTADLQVGSLGRLGPEELAKAVVYAELLGKPRAVSPYAGPPALQ